MIQFNATNVGFLDSLKAKHPDLNPKDLRFCALLRMNLSSKEISRILSISLRSMEVKRYRLRGKLNLEHDRNLVEYIMECFIQSPELEDQSKVLKESNS